MVIPPATQEGGRPSSRAARVLERLVSSRVFGPHALFFVTGEGTFFPNGMERVSGLVLDQRGDVWSFWTGWDSGRSEVVLADWEQISPEPEWCADEEYQQARTAVRLPARP